VEAPIRSRVGLQVGGRSYDVAIPAGVALYEVLREVGVDLGDPALAVVDSAGHQVDRYSTTGDQLVDGSVLHVVSSAQVGRAASRAVRTDDPAATRPPTSAWWLAGAGVAAVVLVVTAGLDAGTGAASSTWRDRAVLAVALGVVALALAGLRARALGSSWPTVVAALAGAAAGAIAVDPAMAASGRLMVVAALVSAMVPVGVRWAVGRRNRDEIADFAGVLLVVLAVSAAVTSAAVLLDLPPALPVAALFGGIPLALRALPAMCVDVPDEQLVDVSLVARTASAVRAPETESLGAVNDLAVLRTVRSAERRRDSGTTVLSMAAPALAPFVLASVEPGLTRWAAVGACVLVVIAVTLAPRTTRGELLHWVPRVCALVVLVEVALFGGVADEDAALPVTLALVVLGLGVAALSLPIGKAWRSVGFSRLADVLESLATVLALPVALLGAGAIEVFRALTS
jgi:hypothetical protein